MNVRATLARDYHRAAARQLEPAHRTREGAVAWCDENRKLEGGDPIVWGNAFGKDYGESWNVRDPGKMKLRTACRYTLQAIAVRG